MKNDYQNIVEILEEFFQDHPQINSVDLGQELQLDLNKFELWPRAFMKTINSTYEGRWIYSMEFLIMDRVNNDQDNIVTVMNDMHMICVDFISYMNHAQLVNPLEVTLEPIYSHQDTVTSGWRISATILSTLGLGCYD